MSERRRAGRPLALASMRVSAVALLLGLGGCAGTNIGQFSAGRPSMAPQDWMVGTVDGYGLIIDRFDKVQSQFHAHEVGQWNAAAHSVTLTERINFLQGSTSKPTDRVWTFTETAPGHWTGTAADVIGTAIGTQQGNAWHLVFHQYLPVGGRQIDVRVDDWRLRESDDVALDRSTISKFGIRLASAQIAFVKAD